MTRPVCPYCGEKANLRNGEQMFPHREDLSSKTFWRCDPCDAHVGCHRGTTNPLGRLAKPELRKLKVKVHNAFDPIWKRKVKHSGGAHKSRTEAYAWLAEKMGLTKDQCHMGWFDEAQCEQAIRICETELAYATVG